MSSPRELLQAANYALTSEKGADEARRIAIQIIREHPNTRQSAQAIGILKIIEMQPDASKGKSHTVAGTGIGVRAKTIRKYCKEGMPLRLIRETNNPHDSNAIAVQIEVPGFFGKKWKSIGYIKKSRNKGLAKKLDQGERITAQIRSFYAPPEREVPRVSILIFDDS